jgi:hypothetical protein
MDGTVLVAFATKHGSTGRDRGGIAAGRLEAGRYGYPLSGPDGEDFTRSGGLPLKEPRVRRPRLDHFLEAGRLGADSPVGADIESRNRHDWARRVAEAVMTGGTQHDPAQTHVLTGADHQQTGMSGQVDQHLPALAPGKLERPVILWCDLTVDLRDRCPLCALEFSILNQDEIFDEERPPVGADTGRPVGDIHRT